MCSERRKCRVTLVILFMAASVAVIARADETTLLPIPAAAPVVIQIHGVSRTEERLVAMLKTASPDFAARIKTQIDERLNRDLKGRRLEGLAPAGPDFIVVTALPESKDGAAKIAYVARVTNFSEFEQGLLKPQERSSLTTSPQGYQVAMLENGERLYLFQRQDYAFFTSKKEVAEQLRAGQPELKLNGKLASEFVNSDLAIYWNLEAINKHDASRMQAYRQDELKRFGAESRWMKNQPKMTVAFFDAAINGLFDVVADGRAAIGAVEIQPHGLTVHGQVDVGPKTHTASLFKSFAPLSTDELSSLPAGQTIYWATTLNDVFLEKLESLTGIGRGAAPSSRALQAGFDELMAAKPRSALGSVSFPLNALKIYHYQAPNKAAAATRDLLQGLDHETTLGSAAIQGKPAITLNAEVYRGFHLSSASLKWDFEKMLANYSVPQAKKDRAEAAMRRLIGEGIQIWSGTNGKINVQVTAQDWPSARRLLDRYLDGEQTLGEQPAYQRLRSSLPAHAATVGLFDLNRLLGATLPNRKASEASASAHAPSATEAPEEPSFVSLAVQFNSQSGEFQLWFPATAVRAFHRGPGS